MLLLFRVVHFPPAEYEEAILYPVDQITTTTKRIINKESLERRERAEANHAAPAGLPDGHVLVDEVDVSEHDFPRQHGEGEGACGASRHMLCVSHNRVQVSDSQTKTITVQEYEEKS